jgi:hypothetical protein
MCLVPGLVRLRSADHRLFFRLTHRDWTPQEHLRLEPRNLLIETRTNTHSRIHTSSPRIYNAARRTIGSRNQAEIHPFHHRSCTRCHSVRNRQRRARRSLPLHRGPGMVKSRDPSSPSVRVVLTRLWNRNLNTGVHQHRFHPHSPSVGSWLCRLFRK